MNSTRSLPVIMPVVPGQRWSCHSCGECCKTLVGHLFPHERDRLDADGWADKLGVAPYVRLGREWVLNKRDDGSCVFLDDKNRCRIHAEFGEAAKPLACRIFPFSVRPADQDGGGGRGWQATLRFDCPSVTDSLGEPVARHQQAVQSLADSMASASQPHQVKLKGRLRASPQEVDGLMVRLVRWFDRDDVQAERKFVVFARLACALHLARLKKVRDDRFLELVDLLISGFAAEAEKSPSTPTVRQQSMARQFVLACSEHVSLSELQAGLIGRWRKRAEQLARAKRFLRGTGVVPALRGFSQSVTFENVERVLPASRETDEIEDLLMRYVRARLAGRSVFGGGYYDWPITSGLGALAMSMVAVGWVARYIAATEQRTVLTLSDVRGAVRLVDRGVTRVRALGTIAERGRIAFLMGDEGIAALVAAYRMVESK